MFTLGSEETDRDEGLKTRRELDFRPVPPVRSS